MWMKRPKQLEFPVDAEEAAGHTSGSGYVVLQEAAMQTNQATKIFIPWALITTIAIMMGNIIGDRSGENFGFALGDIVERVLQGAGLRLPFGYVPSMIAGLVNGLVAGLLIGFLQWHRLVCRQWYF
jgi:hypothetical protein